MQPSKIMLPVDGSVQSTHAAKEAVDLAKAFGAQIDLVHCHHAFPHILGEPYYQEAVDKIINGAEELINPYRELLNGSGVEYEEHLLEGPPGTVIPDLAARLKTDLIVMGSRGLSDLEGLVLGSVTHKVLHMVNCPVLVIK